MTFRYRDHAIFIAIIGALALVAGVLSSCERKPPPWIEPLPSPQPSSSSTSRASPSPSSSPGAACEIEPTTERLANWGEKSFPAVGRLVVESHLRTKDESYSGKDGFPKKVTEGIDAHLERHAAVLGVLGVTPPDVYRHDFEREWTPSENGGVVGQGSEPILPSIEEETFGLNLPWKSGHPSRPPEKWLVINTITGAALVGSMGYESGPTSSPKYLGGMQPAVGFFLRASGSTPLRLGKLRDQSLPFGPVRCAR